MVKELKIKQKTTVMDVINTVRPEEDSGWVQLHIIGRTKFSNTNYDVEISRMAINLEDDRIKFRKYIDDNEALVMIDTDAEYFYKGDPQFSEIIEQNFGFNPEALEATSWSVRVSNYRPWIILYVKDIPDKKITGIHVKNME